MRYHRQTCGQCCDASANYTSGPASGFIDRAPQMAHALPGISGEFRAIRVSDWSPRDNREFPIFDVYCFTDLPTKEGTHIFQIQIRPAEVANAPL